jgi:hypothetical protein
MSRNLLLVVSAVLLLSGLADQPSAQEWDRPFTGFLPGTEPDNVSVFLVRDARSCAPIPGVKVRQFLEDIAPRTTAAPLLAEAVTDEFGLVSIPWKNQPRDCHWIFEKPGYAVEEEYGSIEGDRIALERARETHGQILDPFGRPRAHVAIELFLGCGHSPAVRHATTDAHGRFVLRDVPRHGQLWFPFAGNKADYFDLEFGLTSRPPVYATDPGVVLRGIVTDEEGSAVADAVVRSPQEFRGPTAITAKDGSFVLTGLAPGEPVVVHGPNGRIASLGRETFDVERTVRITLRKIDECDGRPDEPAKDVPVRFQVVDESSGTAVPDVPVFLVREDDGHVFAVDVDAQGTGEVKAPAGKFLLRAGGDFSSHVAPPRAVEIRPNGPSSIRIQARPQAQLQLRLENFPDRFRALDVILPRAMHAVKLRDSKPVFLPADGPAVVRANAEGLVRFVPVGPVREGRRHATLTWPRKKRIQVDFDRACSLSLRDTWFQRTADGGLATHASGDVVLVVEHEKLGAQEVVVRLPEQPGATIRVAATALRPAEELLVSRPDGSRLTTGAVTADGHAISMGEDGRAISWHLTPGAHVMVRAPGLVPLRRTLVGHGPHHLSWGRSTLAIRLKKPMDFIAYLDGILFEGKEGRLQLRGIDAGPHTVIVSARSHQGRAMRLILEPGQARSVDVALAPR